MKNLFFILLGIVIFSCNDHEASSYLPSIDEEVSTEMAPINIDKVKEEMTPKKIIKTGNIAFETDTPKKSKSTIIAACKSLGGYVSSENSQNRSNQISYYMKVRIPSDKFDEFLERSLKGVDELERKEINQKDVTAQFIDLEARLKSKKALEQRYLKLLEKAKNVSEMLQIERELNQIRTEIEVKQGKLKYLKSQVSFSTIEFEFYKMSQPKVKKFTEKLGNSFVEGWSLLKSFILGITALWPFLILTAVVIYIVKLVKRRNSKKNA